MTSRFIRAVRGLSALTALWVACSTTGQAQDSAQRAALAQSLQSLRTNGESPALPDAEEFTFGDRSIAANTRAVSTVAVANGTLTVSGTVAGDAISWKGDIIVAPGGVIAGRAVAIGGKVRLNGGRVDGEIRSLEGNLDATGVAVTPLGGAAAVSHSLSLAAAWLAVLVFLGVGILVVASPNLDAVTDALEQGVGRAIMTGLAGEVAILPAIVVISLGLVLTLLGILLVPFAIVAYVILVAGLFALGFLAVARVIGTVITRSRAGDGDREQRASSLRALIVGVLALMSPWFLAASLAWQPMVHLVAQTIAIAVTSVAATAGLGAAILSRGGVQRRPSAAAVKAMAAASWQTPTPVAGVVAARRPSSYDAPVAK